MTSRRPVRAAGVRPRRTGRRGAALASLAGGVLALGAAGTGCAAPGPAGGGAEPAPAALRGFGVEVDAALAPRVPRLHLRTCGSWGCHEQDVPVTAGGRMTPVPCGGASGSPAPPAGGPDGAACASALPGGDGHGYAPVPKLTAEPVTVTLTTPRRAPRRIRAVLRVRPALVCPGGGRAGASSCPGGQPQATLRVAADGTVRQAR